MLQFKEYEMVELRHDLPHARLQTGNRGAVVMVYSEPTQAYEVEFVDERGFTLALLILKRLHYGFKTA